MSLLPPNAAQLERGLEQATARAGNVTVDFTPLWNPQTCPIELLPYLAFALSIDSWDPAWPEATKRALVSTAIDIQRHKGTAKSIRDIIRTFGGQIALREWWQMAPPGTPHTFSVVLSLTGAAGEAPSAGFIDQIIEEIRRTKPVRSHFTFSQAIVVTGGIRPVGAARPALFYRLGAETAVNPSRAFDFTAGALPIGATLSRSTSGTCVDAAGVLATRSAHTARFDYSGGVLLGLLIEPARTNSILRSDEISNASWQKTGVTVTADAINGPTGTMIADLVTEDSTTNIHTVSQTVTVADSTGAFFVKDNGRRYCYIYLLGRTPTDAASQRIVVFDIQTGTITIASAGVAGTITPVGNGWYRISMTGVTSASAARELRFGLTNNADGNQSYAGGGALGMYVAGSQLEAGATATSVIDTTTAAVTRAADALTLNWATRGVLDGMRNIRYTFDNLSTQTVATAVSGGLAIVPTTLNRARLRSAEAL